MVVGGGIDGCELGRETLDRALGLHDLSNRHAGKVELDRKRLRKQSGIALGNSSAAPGADLDLDNALCLERAQSIARHNAAHVEPLGQILLGAEEIARAQRLAKQRLAHLRNNPRRKGRAAKSNDVPLDVVDRRMQAHGSEMMIKILSLGESRPALTSGCFEPRPPDGTDGFAILPRCSSPSFMTSRRPAFR